MKLGWSGDSGCGGVEDAPVCRTMRKQLRLLQMRDMGLRQRRECGTQFAAIGRCPQREIQQSDYLGSKRDLSEPTIRVERVYRSLPLVRTRACTRAHGVSNRPRMI